MPFDLQRVRQDTPGCAHVLHFNNAGSSLMPQPVLDATVAHLQLEARIGGYEAAAQAKNSIEHVYDAVATLISCSRDEVAILENATRAWDMAFYSIPFKSGDRILTASTEYASNYIAFLQQAQKTGAVIEVIPNDEHGQVSLDALRKMLDNKVRLIAFTHVPTNSGIVQPIAAIGKIAREAGILYLVDACQSVGQMPIDVQSIGCDMLSATGRKYLRGPRGTGFLYVRRAILERLDPPFLDLHAAEWVAADRYEIRQDARRFENWETNYAGKIGLGVAIDYANHLGLDTIWRRVKTLAYQLRSQLTTLPDVIVRDRGITQCGIVTFTIEGHDPEDIKRKLAASNINVSVATRNGALLDMDARKLTSVVRASVHYYNSEEEIERFCQHIAHIIG
ncbi:MAG: aminotransferase class V-fold PLP-dependent enzyme [Ktedonobacteraceae bacterium]